MGSIKNLNILLIIVYISLTSFSFLKISHITTTDANGLHNFVSLESTGERNDTSNLHQDTSLSNRSDTRDDSGLSPKSGIATSQYDDDEEDDDSVIMKKLASMSLIRPKLYLHIGIPKTGSTTIQHHLKQDEHSGILQKYNMTYYECPNISKIYDPIAGKDVRNWSRFAACLVNARVTGNGKDAIYSQEVFGHLLGSIKDNSRHLDHLKEVTADWNVTIVVSYRRFFEWLPSYYYQEQTTQSFESPVPFVDWYQRRLGPPDGKEQSNYKRRWGAHIGEMHPTRVLIRKFETHFDNIVIHNMHEEPKHLVNNFYEKILGLKEISQQRRKLPEDSLVSNNIGYLNEFLLAYAGKKHNLYPDSVTRFKANRVAHSMLSSQNKTASNSLPMKCISSKHREQLLEASLRFEEDLFPEYFSSKNGKEDHVQKFAKAVERNKFCSLDVESAIKSKTALDFFSHLKESINVARSFEEEMKHLHVGDLVRYADNERHKMRVAEIVKIQKATDRLLLTVKFRNRETKVIDSNKDDLSKLSAIGFTHEEARNDKLKR